MNAETRLTEVGAWMDETAFFNCSREELLELHATLVDHYKSAGRAYHNMQHIHQLLTLATTCRDQFKCWPAVYLAIWFHDAVYTPGSSNNERKSAELARLCLEKLHLEETLISRVANLVQATEKHRIQDDDGDGQLFLDLDMSILAAPWEEYQAYALAVASEYASVPRSVYRAGRRRFLREMLERRSIYLSAYAKERWEERARSNIKLELEQLKTARAATL